MGTSTDISTTKCNHVRTHAEQYEFEIQRFDGLLRLHEQARDDKDKVDNAFAVCRALRNFLTTFFGLERD